MKSLTAIRGVVFLKQMHQYCYEVSFKVW